MLVIVSSLSLNRLLTPARASAWFVDFMVAAVYSLPDCYWCRKVPAENEETS